MTGNFEWLYKSRTPYWEIDCVKYPGKRYAAFRQIKNRFGNFAGRYTLDSVCTRVPDITPSILRTFESGVDLSSTFVDGILPKLIEDLGITQAMFKTTEKITVKDPKASDNTTGSVATEAKTPKEAKVENTKSVSKLPVQTSSTDKGLTIVNHTLSSFVVIIKDGDMHIYDDCAEVLKKVPNASWVAPADDIGGGHKIMPRSTVIKR